MTETKIIWVQDYIDGPLNGVMEVKIVIDSQNQEEKDTKEEKEKEEKDTKEEKNTKEEIEHQEKKIEFKTQQLWFKRQNNARVYDLYEIDSETMKILKENHIKYCRETGAPLKYGDPYKVVRRQGNKPYFFKHKVNPLSIEGKLIFSVDEEQIINYKIQQSCYK